MAFVAKLPTWHNAVQVYRRASGIWVVSSSVTGQVYTPLRNQDDEDGGLIYFQYPVASAAAIRDAYSAAADMLVIEFPGGRNVGFHVREILPRWLGFPNQHMIASLSHLHDAILADRIEGDPIVYPDDGVGGDCSLTAHWSQPIRFLSPGYPWHDIQYALRTNDCTFQSEVIAGFFSDGDQVRLQITMGLGDRMVLHVLKGLGPTLAAVYRGITIQDGVADLPEAFALQWNVSGDTLPLVITVNY